MMMFLIGIITGWLACGFFMLVMAKYNDSYEEHDELEDDLLDDIDVEEDDE